MPPVTAHAHLGRVVLVRHGESVANAAGMFTGVLDVPLSERGVLEAHRAAELGAGEILLNSMDADGTKDGYDLEMIAAVRKHVSVPVIASGGVSSVDDLVALSELAPIGLEGAIVGKALYAGNFTLEEALAAVR